MIIDKPDAVQTQIRVGEVGLAYRDPDHFAAQVYDEILGSGFAIVNGDASFPSTYTTLQAHIPSSFNCVQGAVEARRVGEGNYRVRFTNNASNVATANAWGSGGNFNAFVALSKESTENSFEVVIRNPDGQTMDHHFVIMLG